VTLEYFVNRNLSSPTNNVRYGSTSFAYYFDQNKLVIDIWDGDTLLYIGQAAIDLRKGLRQGRDAVSFETHTEITLIEV
jgi:hypothetical protein